MKAVLLAIAFVCGLGLCTQTCCGRWFAGEARADQVDTALARLCPGHQGYATHLREAGRRYMLHPRLLTALMWVESRCDRTAVSRVGALGLMQLFGVSRSGLTRDQLLDPRTNIMAGARWLSLRSVECGSIEKGLGAYNARYCHAGRRFARWVLAVARK